MNVITAETLKAWEEFSPYPDVPAGLQEKATPEFQSFGKIARYNREIVVTEKIDGTNAQIFFDDDLKMHVGSRSRWLSEKEDNHGFFKWAKANEAELRKLGPGRHFGEWWGQGIQRNYGLKEKRFSLFNTSRWLQYGDVLDVNDLKPGQEVAPKCCHVVPELYRGPMNEVQIRARTDTLSLFGSRAAPGFMKPEGIVVYHAAAKTLFKITLENDEKPKGSNE